MDKSLKLNFLLSTCFIGLISINPSFAKVPLTGDEDVLFNVSKKINQIEQRLKDQGAVISPESMEWREIEDFNKELMYVVAHDPSSPLKDVPIELTSEKLTEQLQLSWTKLEESSLKIGKLIESEEWKSLKSDMEQFFSYRRELLYQPARAMVKTGLLSGKIKSLKAAAAESLKNTPQGRRITFRVIDPVLEELSGELKQLNSSVRELEDLRRPKKIENLSIFRSKNIFELGILAAGALATGIFVTSIVFWFSAIIQRKRKEKEVALENEKLKKIQESGENQFDYSEWLKRLEKNLQALKRNEDNLVEDTLCLINYSHELKEARKLFNEAKSQQEKDESLKKLNAASKTIEDYFEKFNVKKNTESSRNIMKNLIELCEAVESGLEIRVKKEERNSNVVKLRVA